MRVYGKLSLLLAITLIYQYAQSYSFSIAKGHGINGWSHPHKLGLKISMAQIEVSMPALSSTMKEGKIVAWSKSIGDKVEVGDVLMVVESDKADMDVEAFEEG